MGNTVNPWDAGRTSGASSGGDAVAVATGMAPLGLGGDGLGSLRWPAQCCGITTLEATFGRIPAAGDMPIAAQLAVDGPMTRRVADLRVAFEVLAGPTEVDPRTVPASLHGPPVPPPVGVAVVLDPAGGGTTPQVQDPVRTAAQVLLDAGYGCEEAEPPGVQDAAQVALSMFNTPELRALLGQLDLFEEPTRRFLTEFYDAAGDPDPVTTCSSFITRNALLRRWGEFQQTHPLILAPICTDIPFRVGTDLDAATTIEDALGVLTPIDPR